MAHYDITYTCGHTDRVNLIGPHRTREQRIRWIESGVCWECQKTAQYESAKAQAQDLELPALVGSEKQIPWAETLRTRMLTNIEAEVERLERRAAEPDANDEARATMRLVLQAVEAISTETAAKQWIDWRAEQPLDIIRATIRKLQAAPAKAEVQERQQQAQAAEIVKAQALAEATVRPPTPITETVAEISVSGTTISIRFPEKRDDFRAVVKPLGYAWEGDRWQRAIGRWNGTPEDRAAEAGHALLNAGFCACILDDALRAKAVAGDYAPECTRWVRQQTQGEYAGWFLIAWQRPDDFYAAARRIPGSRYSSPHIMVPAAQFAEVQDFAARYEFQLSDGAREVVAKAEAAQAAQLVVQPAPRKKAAPAKGDSKPPVLPVPDAVEIAGELRDD